MTGIYGIHNLKNDKWYVGQAVDIESRWKQHRWALSNGYHYNRHLLRSWNKYSSDSFEFVILETCNQDQLNDREIYWIANLNSTEHGYNRSIGGKGGNGFKWTNESKEIFALSRQGDRNPFYGKQHTDEYKTRMVQLNSGELNPMYGHYGKDHPKSRKVLCVETGIIYDGLHEAGRQTGVHPGNISSCCRGRLKTAGKLHWKYII